MTAETPTQPTPPRVGSPEYQRETNAAAEALREALVARLEDQARGLNPAPPVPPGDGRYAEFPF